MSERENYFTSWLLRRRPMPPRPPPPLVPPLSLLVHGTHSRAIKLRSLEYARHLRSDTPVREMYLVASRPTRRGVDREEKCANSRGLYASRAGATDDESPNGAAEARKLSGRLHAPLAAVTPHLLLLPAFPCTLRRATFNK